VGALVGGDFKFEGFKTENKLGHYLLGAVLMGFGAVLAGGCTVWGRHDRRLFVFTHCLVDIDRHLAGCRHGLAY